MIPASAPSTLRDQADFRPWEGSGQIGTDRVAAVSSEADNVRLPEVRSVALTSCIGLLDPVRRLRPYFLTFRYTWTDPDMSTVIRIDPATGRRLFATRAA